jgi:hypothetical protein
MPALVMIIPQTHNIKLRPTEPESWKMALGVANIPVPTMRLKMRKTAEIKPSCRQLAGMDLSSTPENFVSLGIQGREDSKSNCQFVSRLLQSRCLHP